MPSKRRGGFPALLTGLRLATKMPLTRTLVRKLAEEVESNGRKTTVALEALRLIAEHDTNSCLIARFYSKILSLVFKIAIACFHGEEEEVVEALRDPAVRRGLALVLEGLALYGVTVPQELPAPFLVVWNFTNACNLRCKHCYQRAGSPLPAELTLREKLDVVRQLDRAGVAAVAFSGGEPTIHPHFPAALKAAADAGMYTALATNGLALADRGYARKLKELGLRYVEVSVASADPDKHDRFRGVEGAWERAIRGLRNAVELGFSTAMATTVTRLNLDEVDGILDLAEEIGVQRVVFFNFIPVGRGEGMKDLDLTPGEREELLKKLYRENQRRRLEIYSTAPQFARVSCILSSGREVAATHYAKGDPVISSLAEYIGGCGAGRIYAAIQPNGDVTPCVFMPTAVVGNVAEVPFKEIWSESEVFMALRDRDRLKGYCGACPYRYVCGGCRARALAYTGDILGPDPGCILNTAGPYAAAVPRPLAVGRGGGGRAR